METQGLQLDPDELRKLDLGLQIPNRPMQQMPLGEPQMAPPPPLRMPDQKPDLSIQSPRGTVEGDQAERTRELTTGSGISQISKKIQNSQFGQNHPLASKILGGLSQGLATAADLGISMISPFGPLIPGTEEHHLAGLNRLNKQIGQEEGEREKEAQTREQEATAGLHGAQAEAAELSPASQEEALAYGVPIGTPMTAATRAALAKQQGINQTKIQTTADTNQTHKDIAAANNITKEKLADLKPEQRDDHAIRLWQKQQAGEQLTPEDESYLAAYSHYIDATKIQPQVARAKSYGMFKPVTVTNPDGTTRYEWSGNAIESGAETPASLPFKTALAMARYMTSGKGGASLTAYRTAYDHLDLLSEAANALQNGDVQILNRLGNDFKQQFGSAAPTNFDAIKTMLAGEIGNVAKTTGATDQEIAAIRDELNRAQSPEQIQGVIQSNQDLMDQKGAEMLKQYQGGMNAQPVFGHGKNTESQPTFKVRLADAMALPQNKGKTEAEVEADVKKHGGEVVR